MVGDEENTEFISENPKPKDEVKLIINDNQQIKKNQHAFYYGTIFFFGLFIIGIFWMLSIGGISYKTKFMGFHNKDAHLLILSNHKFEYLDDFNKVTNYEDCNSTQTISKENTLIVASDNKVTEEFEECVGQLKNKVEDIVLIVYNATKESVQSTKHGNYNYQYYLSSMNLSGDAQNKQMIGDLKPGEQEEVIAQIINNIFK